MAQVRKAGKLVPFDGTGTNTPAQHLGVGAPPAKSMPHKTMPPAFKQNMKTPVRSRTAATGTGDTSGDPAPRAADASRQSAPPPMQSATGRGTTGKILSNNWGAQSLRKVSAPPAQPHGSINQYAQANDLASSRFVQPRDAATQRVRPANNVHDDTARDMSGSGHNDMQQG